MRVILNYDLPAFMMPHLAGSELINSLFGSSDLIKSPITEVWWNLGEGNQANFYDSAVIEDCTHPRQQEMVEYDLITKLVEETRGRDLACGLSYRINGNDSDGGDIADVRFKMDNPTLLLDGAPFREGKRVQLFDFSYSEVREHKLAILGELLRKWGWDVIEIDFARACPVLPPGTAWTRRGLITNFMRDVQSLCGEFDTRICARVPETLVGCHFDGLDVGQWVEKGYVDMLTVGCRSFEIGSEFWSGFSPAGSAARVPCYPVLDEVHSSDGYHHAPLEVYRGVIANWRHQGFDTIQCFNFQDSNPRADLAPEWEESGWLQKRWEHHKAFYGCLSSAEGRRTYVVQRRHGGRAPSMISHPWDWDHPERQYCNTNPEGQLPAYGAKLRIRMYVAEAGVGHLTIYMVDTTPCKVWVNNILVSQYHSHAPETLVVTARPEDGGSPAEFLVAATSMVEGENLVTIQAYTMITKVELSI